jgi:hypothetical protein
MITPPEETTLVTLSGTAGAVSGSLESLAQSVSKTLLEGALRLPAELNLGRLLVGIMQGSGFSGGLTMATPESQAKVLVTPEELSLSMTCKLMEEMNHE